MSAVNATQIGPGTYVELTYTLYDEDGDLVEDSEPDGPLAYVHGYGQVIPGLERGVEGMVQGQHRDIVVACEDAYGEHDPGAIFEVDRTEFPYPEQVQINDEFDAEGPQGVRLSLRVVDVLGEAFVVDANHPLAGQRLRFSVTVATVRPATQDEITQAEQELQSTLELDEHEGHSGCGCGHDHHDQAQTEGPGLITLGTHRGKPS